MKTSKPFHKTTAPKRPTFGGFESSRRRCHLGSETEEYPTSNVQEESLHEHDHVHENVLPLGNRKVHSLAPETHCRQYVTAHKSQCWKCGRDLEERVEQFFCECGVVLPVNECLNYFDVMGVSKTFEQDPATLRGIFRNLQKDLHPDKFSKQSKMERDFSEQQSSLVNKAYSTLLKPLNRGQYLLEVLGHPVEEIDKSDDASFLMEMMEINEKLEEAQSLEVVHRIKENNDQTMSDIITEIATAFQNDAIEDAKGLLIKLNYYSNIDEKIKAIQQTYTGVI
ncbi:Iron-sulfur cluster co-chaperone protein HscB [Lamellibrachia satsuma]|nr:Iron-sulfur cluster co-chaperone protein HscB [Lamellibrachia satsuma]